MRLKLFLAFTFIVLVSVSLVAIIARSGAVNEVRMFMYRGGMVGLNDLATELENYYQVYGTWDGVRSILNLNHAGVQGMGGMMNQRLLLADASGTVLLSTREGNTDTTLAQSELAVAIPLKVNGKTQGYLYTAGGMGINTASQQALVNRLNRGVLLAGLVAGVLGLLLAFGLAYTLLHPVHELTLASQKLAQGDLSQRVEIHGKDEMATLGQAFNHMADSLQQAEESRRLMTADIAHELRTPLAVQRANLEALQDGVYPLTVQNLSPVVEQNHLLTHLVDDLRTLALADAGQIELERIPTDLPTLARRVVEQFQPQAALNQVTLHFSPPATELQLIPLDPIRLEQMLTNLLSNALRYTPQGGQIEVAMIQIPKFACLTVRDSGQGIPQDALPFIFERFYRADKSRSRAEGGSGLGLAIARNLARAHGGDLTATNHASGGALFTLTLPL